MGPHAMDTPRKGGDDGDQILDQLLLHRASRLLMNDGDFRAMTLKIALEIIEPKSREPIGVCNHDFVYLVLLDEAAELFQPRPAGIKPTADIVKNMTWLQLSLLTEFLSRGNLPGEVPILLLIMRRDAAVNRNLGRLYWQARGRSNIQYPFNFYKRNSPMSAYGPVTCNLPGSIPPPNGFCTDTK